MVTLLVVLSADFFLICHIFYGQMVWCFCLGTPDNISFSCSILKLFFVWTFCANLSADNPIKYIALSIQLVYYFNFIHFTNYTPKENPNHFNVRCVDGTLIVLSYL